MAPGGVDLGPISKLAVDSTVACSPSVVGTVSSSLAEAERSPGVEGGGVEGTDEPPRKRENAVLFSLARLNGFRRIVLAPKDDVAVEVKMRTPVRTRKLSENFIARKSYA